MPGGLCCGVGRVVGWKGLTEAMVPGTDGKVGKVWALVSVQQIAALLVVLWMGVHYQGLEPGERGWLRTGVGLVCQISLKFMCLGVLR